MVVCLRWLDFVAPGCGLVKNVVEFNAIPFGRVIPQLREPWVATVTGASRGPSNAEQIPIPRRKRSAWLPIWAPRY